MTLLFLESLGTTELLVIMVVALVLFGPRRLPEMARTFGKSLNEFKRTSDEFKRTWEREVAVENVEREAAISRAMIADPAPPSQFPADEAAPASPVIATTNEAAATDALIAPRAPEGSPIARGSHTVAAIPGAPAEASEAEQPSRKPDWL